MFHRLMLKVTKFQLPSPKRSGTVVENILGDHHVLPPPQMSNRVNIGISVPSFRAAGCLGQVLQRNWKTQ